MKKIVFSTLTAVCLSLTANATVWRVSNVTGADPDFTAWNAAVSSSSVVNGDTLYVEPSATNYGSVSLNKQLVVIGNGYFLDTAGTANGNPGLQENVNTSYFSRIRLNAGSEGSHFIGIVFTSTQYLDNSLASTNTNITFEKCAFASGVRRWSTAASTLENITFRKCIFYGTGNSDLFNSGNATLNNLTFENCIFRGWVRSNPSTSSTNLVFRNNVADYMQVSGYYVANSIFVNNSNSTLTSCVVRNNIFEFNEDPTEVPQGPLSTNGNNLVGVASGTVILESGSTDGYYQLAAGSPAIGGGVDIGGVKPDCGPFGGPDPYVLSGIPNIPTIYSLEFPNGNSVSSGASSILVDFSTRGNN
jgi:hypothetical protein